jgi:hypothetical protein
VNCGTREKASSSEFQEEEEEEEEEERTFSKRRTRLTNSTAFPPFPLPMTADDIAPGRGGERAFVPLASHSEGAKGRRGRTCGAREVEAGGGSGE